MGSMAIQTEDLQAAMPTTRRDPHPRSAQGGDRGDRTGPRAGVVALWLEVRGVQAGRSSTTSISRPSPTPTRATSAWPRRARIVVPAAAPIVCGARAWSGPRRVGAACPRQPNSPSPKRWRRTCRPRSWPGDHQPTGAPGGRRARAVGEPGHRQSRRARRSGRAGRERRHRLPAAVGRVPGLRHVADDAAPGDRDDAARRGPRAHQDPRRHRPRRRREPFFS